jgi:hypothetical protein
LYGTASSNKTQVWLQIRIRKHPEDGARRIQKGERCGVSPPSAIPCDSARRSSTK